jgi:anti-sigma B factor antagonist
MIVRSTTVDGVQSVRLEGDDSLDYNSAAHVKRQFADSIRSDRDVVLDLSEVAFVDSAGLSALVGLFKNTHAAGRKLLLVGVRPQILEVMEVIRLDQIFRFAGSLEDAVERLRDAV